MSNATGDPNAHAELSWQVKYVGGIPQLKPRTTRGGVRLTVTTSGVGVDVFRWRRWTSRAAACWYETANQHDLPLAAGTLTALHFADSSTPRAYTILPKVLGLFPTPRFEPGTVSWLVVRPSQGPTWWAFFSIPLPLLQVEHSVAPVLDVAGIGERVFFDAVPLRAD